MPSPTTQASTPVRLALALLHPSAAVIPIDGPMLVGRSTDCDVVLETTSASRAHARLCPTPSGVEIIDLHSRNGIFLDGRRIVGRATVHGGVLRMGDSVAVVTSIRASIAGARELATPLIGGASLDELRMAASAIGRGDRSVHLVGEPGTGKQLVARWLHELGGRSGPFVSVNCAALPLHVVETELLGRADNREMGIPERQGLIAAAARGTLFLDAIGELPIDAQRALLRVLECERSADARFRLVTATNVDLSPAIESGRFDRDLADHIRAAELRLPALRDRLEDLTELSSHLIERSSAAVRLLPDVVEVLARHHWSQNIRELDQVLRSCVSNRRSDVTLADLPPRMQLGFRLAPIRATPSDYSAEITHARVDEVLREHHGNVRRVSATLGIARTRLYRLMEKWSVDPNQYRRSEAASTPHDQVHRLDAPHARS
ncbi:MAG: sigma 54-interacting transcriptional regulator [Kofleriaceae bacterium]